MNTHIIYKLIFPNGKVYVGQTIQKFYKRMYCHEYSAYNRDYNKLISKAIRKYGWDNVKQEIICTVSEEFVDDAERYFIKKYNSTNKNFGYNLEDGGCKNKHHSKETKKKISIKLCGENHPMWNRQHSKKSKEKMSNSHVGLSLGKEHPMFGKRRFDLIEKNKNRVKSISMYDKDKNFIKTFESIVKAANELNMYPQHISRVLTNNRKSTGGFIFKYNIDGICV